MSVSPRHGITDHNVPVSTHNTYGEIHGTTDSTIAIVAANTPVQYTGFTANGESNNTTPDHTNDHITITQAGKYLVTVALAARLDSNMGGGFITFHLNLNNGATEITKAPLVLNQVLDVNRAGAVTALLDLSANDTLELWGESSSVIDIVVRNASMTCVMMGQVKARFDVLNPHIYNRFHDCTPKK